ncbi:hypothetical protein ABW636_19045 [Aquimarina sp. 2201CG1-2-11]|uniref:hypothetical protein n=1 Tax=Aquimarina discodermiae TaxID=3231043 RepID=UPI003462EB3F
MKLSLNELQVDSYATQVSENELTDVKGGTSLACLRVAAKWLAVTAAISGYLDEAARNADPRDQAPGNTGIDGISDFVHNSGGMKI